MASHAPPPAVDDERLPLVIVGILVAELLAISGLFWLGQHFA